MSCKIETIENKIVLKASSLTSEYAIHIDQKDSKYVLTETVECWGRSESKKQPCWWLVPTNNLISYPKQLKSDASSPRSQHRFF